MKVAVDRDLCEGNGKCEEVAPTVFEVRDDEDEDEKAFVLIEQPGDELREQVERAVMMCPKTAIRAEG